MIRAWVRDHSLTLALLAIGLTLLAPCPWVPEGKWFDILLTFGAGFLVVALLNVMAGPLRERNRPDL